MIIRSTNFKISFCILLAISTIFFGIFCVNDFISKDQKQLQNSNNRMIAYVENVNNLIKNFETMSVRLKQAAINLVNTKIIFEHPASYYNFRQRAMDIIYSPLIESVSIHFQDHDYIYLFDSGIYSKDDYFNQEFIQKLNGTNSPSFWIKSLPVYRSGTIHPTIEMLSYAYKSATLDSYITISFNMLTKDFNRYVSIALSNELPNAFIISEDMLIFATDNTLWDTFSSKYDVTSVVDGSKLSLYGQTYRVVKQKSPMNNFTTLSLVEVDGVFMSIMRSLSSNLYLLIIFIVISFALTYAYSKIILRQLALIRERIQIIFPEFRVKSYDKDEYKSLGVILDKFLTKTHEIDHLISQNKLLLRDKHLLDLLVGSNPRDGSILTDSVYDIDFPYSHFLVFFVSIYEIDLVMSISIRDEMVVFVNDCILKVFSEYGHIYSMFEANNKLTFILNTNHLLAQQDRNTITQLSATLHDYIKKNIEVSILFSIGTTETCLSNIWKSYLVAKNNIIYASAFEYETIVFPELYDTVVKKVTLIEHEPSSEKYDTVQNQKVLDSIAYIEQHYMRDISVMDVSDSVSLNSIYLNRIFKISTGKTLSEYLNHYRTQIATKLLTSTNLTISEISSQVGYNEARSFSRNFKKFQNCSPQEYRTQPV